MEEPLLESVPNVSVGRDAATVDAIVSATRAGIEGGAARDGSRASLVDVHRDSDHDRTVLTVLGRGEALACGLEALARSTVELVDLHEGHGVHPRVGVVDVMPVVPLCPAPGTVAAAHALVDRLGAMLGGLGVPVVRYGLGRDEQRLSGAGFTGEVRRGGPATVAERLQSGELTRIAGPLEPHHSAGVTICGVRDVLVAFNVDLDTDDLELARSIARRIRTTSESGDALIGVRALGLRLPSRGISQVSTNLERPTAVGPAHVLETVARIAAEHGAGVSAAELVGLAPDAALIPLRYACTRGGVALLAVADPSLEQATRRVQLLDR